MKNEFLKQKGIEDPTVEALLDEYSLLVTADINKIWKQVVTEHNIEQDIKTLDIFKLIQRDIKSFLPRQAARALIEMITKSIAKYEKENKKPLPPVSDAQAN